MSSTEVSFNVSTVVWNQVTKIVSEDTIVQNNSSNENIQLGSELPFTSPDTESSEFSFEHRALEGSLVILG